MNGFLKNGGWLFSLALGILLHGSLHAMIVYGKHLSDVVPQGEVFLIRFLATDDNVLLKMGKKIFDARSGRDGILNLEPTFEQVVAHKFPFSDTRNMSDDTVDLSWRHLLAQDKMNITAKTSLKLKKCLLESPFISMTSNQMDFIDCFFVRPQVLDIIGNCKNSNYNTIRIIFRDQPTIPTVMCGKIDLKDDETIQELFFSNVKEVQVLFNPQAWKK